MYINDFNRKVNAVFFFLVIFLLVCVARLLYIQFFNANYLAEIAGKQHNLYVELEPRRGTIFDTNFKPQAVNVAAYSLYASPNLIAEKDKTPILQKLAPLLESNYESLKDKVYRNKSFVWLARKLSSQQADQIRKLNIKGVDFIKESKRSYPNGYLASHIIGFAGLDNKGLEGVELLYDNYLKGESGWAVFLRDARQKKLDINDRMVSPKDGFDIVLTIDEVIQYIAERELDKAYKTYHAKGASIIVMDPHTGAILALANRPTYDLNEHGDVTKEQMRNRAICDMFEPGSVFKIVTASAAIEEKKMVEEDRVFCENGSYKVGSHILHDHTSHGWLTFREVIEQSSNIGTTKVAMKLGPQLVYKYARAFGFGSKLGFELQGEISGSLKDPRFWSSTSIGAVPIGQEVGVTSLQLAAAISVIANGGQLMKPFIIKEVKDRFGDIVKQNKPVMIRKVLSLDTALRVKKILAGVVENGTGKLAKVPGFTAAGKTGTAQKLEPSGVYSHNKFVASFIGFAPVEDPLISIVVIVDDPHPYYFGGVVSAPVFKNVASDVLRYLNSKQPIRAGA